MNIDALTNLLIKDEGERLSPYRCSAGHLTIGVGHNLDAKPISRVASRQILKDDIEDVVRDLDQSIPWWRTLSETRQLVLADMCFNLGIQGLMTFRNTLKAAQEGRFMDCAEGMRRSDWAKQVGNRATRLIQMMETDNV
jgi:lysozyme